MGNMSSANSLKLSDFIDEKFLENIDDIEELESNKMAEKKPLGAFIIRLLKSSELPLLEIPSS